MHYLSSKLGMSYYRARSGELISLVSEQTPAAASSAPAAFVLGDGLASQTALRLRPCNVYVPMHTRGGALSAGPGD